MLELSSPEVFIFLFRHILACSISSAYPFFFRRVFIQKCAPVSTIWFPSPRSAGAFPVVGRTVTVAYLESTLILLVQCQVVLYVVLKPTSELAARRRKSYAVFEPTSAVDLFLFFTTRVPLWKACFDTRHTARACLHLTAAFGTRWHLFADYSFNFDSSSCNRKFTSDRNFWLFIFDEMLYLSAGGAVSSGSSRLSSSASQLRLRPLADNGDSSQLRLWLRSRSPRIGDGSSSRRHFCASASAHTPL